MRWFNPNGPLIGFDDESPQNLPILLKRVIVKQHIQMDKGIIREDHVILKDLGRGGTLNQFLAPGNFFKQHNLFWIHFPFSA